MELTRTDRVSDDKKEICNYLGISLNIEASIFLFHPTFLRRFNTPDYGYIAITHDAGVGSYSSFLHSIDQGTSVFPNYSLETQKTWMANMYLWSFEDMPQLQYPPRTYSDLAYFTEVCPRAMENVKIIEKWNIEELKLQEIVVFCDKRGDITALYCTHDDSLWIRFFDSSHCSKDERVEVGKRIEKIISLIRKKKTKRETENPQINIGADIEYTAYDSDGTFHSATEFVRDNVEGSIGTDGNVETVEIRPDYAKTPEKLVENIGELLENLKDSMPDGYDLLCGGGGDLHRSTGTHIHFSGISTDCSDGRRQEIAPVEVVGWLDALLTAPIRNYTRGWARHDENYGRPGDYRCRANHSGFPHNGFEWRVLHTITTNKEMTLAIFALSYMIVYAYESGQKIRFDENKFGIEWYKGLPMFDKYRDQIEYFVNMVLSGCRWDIPTLNGWFGKDFHKDRECDVVVQFSNDGEYLGIKPFVMYNPQKEYDTVLIWNRGDGSNALALSEPVKSLTKYCVELGYTTVIHQPTKETMSKYAKKKKCLFIGVPRRVLARLAERNSGSRNRIKMFAQDLIKNI